MGFCHVASLVLSTCIQTSLPPQHLSYPGLSPQMHATGFGFIAKSWCIVLILLYSGEPLEVGKQRNNIVRFLVLKDCLGTWSFSLMVEHLPDISEALWSTPTITRKVERLFWMLGVMSMERKSTNTEKSGCWPTESTQAPPKGVLQSPRRYNSFLRHSYHTLNILYNEIEFHRWILLFSS